jgi:hypothetical protein
MQFLVLEANNQKRVCSAQARQNANEKTIETINIAFPSYFSAEQIRMGFTDKQLEHVFNNGLRTEWYMALRSNLLFDTQRATEDDLLKIAINREAIYDRNRSNE